MNEQPRRKKATRANGPYIPVDYEPMHVVALQALSEGRANEHQQQIILKWMIEEAAGMYQFSYYPSERDTAFALGRAFVGQQMVKLLKLNSSTLRRESSEE